MTTATKRLHAVRAPAKPRFTFAMLRRAVRFYMRNDLVPRSDRKRNAVKWLLATERLGNRSVLKGAQVTWGAMDRKSLKERA